MFAIVQCKGFQYRVTPEEKLFIPLTDAAPGSTLVIDTVLMVRDGEKLTLGTPLVKGAKVEAEVLRHARGDKIIVGKYKRRKGYHKRNGHRQNYTEILVRSIQA